MQTFNGARLIVNADIPIHFFIKSIYLNKSCEEIERQLTLLQQM